MTVESPRKAKAVVNADLEAGWMDTTSGNVAWTYLEPFLQSRRAGHQYFTPIGASKVVIVVGFKEPARELP